MALVPFRVSGAAASQQLDEQLLQVGPHSLLLHQRPRDSGNTAHLQRPACQQQQATASTLHDQQQQQQQQPDLSRVGLVLWQSGYILADFLLLRLHAATADLHPSSSSTSWAGVRVLELGCGAGTVGMFLALAGAQVVLTDQPHILPLTLENLQLNFPATASNTAAGSSCKDTTASGSFGLRTAAADAAQAGADAAETAVRGECQQQTQVQNRDGDQNQASSEPLSVAAAFAAAFCSDQLAEPHSAANEAATAAAQQQLWQVYAPGPLVAEYTWGEPAHQLHQRVAAAAVARLRGLHTATGSSAADTAAAPYRREQTVQQQLEEAFRQAFDVVVGADLLYDPAGHEPLLSSLQQLCAPHTQVFLCYRCRGLGEEAFETAAAGKGWVVEEVSRHMLHPEYQGRGDYRVLLLTKLG